MAGIQQISLTSPAGRVVFGRTASSYKVSCFCFFFLFCVPLHISDKWWNFGCDVSVKFSGQTLLCVIESINIMSSRWALALSDGQWNICSCGAFVGTLAEAGHRNRITFEELLLTHRIFKSQEALNMQDSRNLEDIHGRYSRAFTFSWHVLTQYVNEKI